MYRSQSKTICWFVQCSNVQANKFETVGNVRGLLKLLLEVLELRLEAVDAASVRLKAGLVLALQSLVLGVEAVQVDLQLRVPFLQCTLLLLQDGHCLKQKVQLLFSFNDKQD